MHFLLWMTAALAVCGIAFYLLALWAAVDFARRRQPPAPAEWPSVSVLKSLRGTDPQMYECFRSHVLQDYPGRVELIFGVSDAADSAAALVRQLQKEYPSKHIQLVEAPQRLGANGKVSTLLQMLPAARHRCLLINDSDLQVEPGYLRSVMLQFSAPEVGMVTALYRGVAARSFGSRLEAMGIATDFIPGVLAARKLEGGLRFALGSTLAMRREALEKIGGLEPLLDYLADDYELGARIARAGYKVAVAESVVENHLPQYSFSGYFRHQLRWGRTMRSARPGGYFGLPLSFGFFWALVTFLAAPASAFTLSLIAAALLSRLAVGVYSGRVLLQDEQVIRFLPLMFLGDLVRVAVWLGSFGSVVHWRGERFRVQGGKLLPLA